jgi:hypothetical protein
MGRVRVRGLAPWTPKPETLPLLDAVHEVLHEYAEQLPLTLRQVFYRLVGAYGYEKTEQAYSRLGEMVNRARRSGRIPFTSIRDDGVLRQVPFGFRDRQEFWDRQDEWIRLFELNRQEGQAQFLEAWVEASGMLPQVAAVALGYGVPCYSSSGFDSVTAKHEAAMRMRGRDVPTVVLHLGDYDPSGVALFENLSGDVTALYLDSLEEDGYDEVDADWVDEPRFVRVAVTPEQIERLELPTAPPKATDRRSVFTDTITVQCEAIPPDQLQAEIREAIEPLTDLDLLTELTAREEAERARLIEDAKRLRDEEGF